MAIYKANDKFRTQLRSTWISSPADGSLLVTSVPTNVPTLVVVGWGTAFESVFSVTGKSGSSAADYALTGVTWLRGYVGNLAENLAVNCLNNEEFFNQYSEFVNDQYLQMAEQGSAPSTPPSGFLRLYSDVSGRWRVKNDVGVDAVLGELSDEWIDIADAATMTFDLGNLTNKLKFLTGALAGNRTFALSNPTEGLVFLIRIRQDGTGSRTVTWFPAASDTVTMTIANPAVITTTLDMKTGTPVVFTTTGALPTGVVSGTTYYWIRTAATTGNIAASKAAALAGTTITSSGSQSGVHTMKPQIIWDGDVEPTLSTSKYAVDDIEFMVESPGQIYGKRINQVKIRVLRQNSTTNSYKNNCVILTGYGDSTGDGATSKTAAETITFGITFADQPIILVNGQGCWGGILSGDTWFSSANEDVGMVACFSALSTSAATFKLQDVTGATTNNGKNYLYNWIAIGVLN